MEPSRLSGIHPPWPVSSTSLDAASEIDWSIAGIFKFYMFEVHFSKIGIQLTNIMFILEFHVIQKNAKAGDRTQVFCLTSRNLYH